MDGKELAEAGILWEYDEWAVFRHGLRAKCGNEEALGEGTFSEIAVHVWTQLPSMGHENSGFIRVVIFAYKATA
jgi:hypothetical protein